MKKRILLVCIFVLSTFLAAAKTPYLRRFALIVGANDGGSDRIRLRYAGSDARSMAGVLRRLGGIRESDILLLDQPGIFDLINGFVKINNRIKDGRTPNGRVELVFYYSGHSDGQGLLLGGRRLGYRLLKKMLDGIDADIKIALLDSCSSGTMVRLKGGRMSTPFLHDTSMKMKGTVILTSSSHNEASQESDRIKGSFFTHYVVSGLRGGADMDRDGRVTLNELYQFAYHQTLAETEKTVSGPQHPGYSIKLSGSGDVVVTDIRRSRSRLILDKKLSGLVSVRKQNGTFVAELKKPEGIQTVLGMEPGRYVAALQNGNRRYETAFSLGSGGSFLLRDSGMRRVTGLSTGVKKGNTVPAITVPAGFRFGISGETESDFNGFGFYLFRTRIRGNGSGFVFSFGSIHSQNYFSGFQFALFSCRNGGDFSGFQNSALWGARSGRDFNGLQWGFFYAINGRDFNGFQEGTFYNENGRNFSGMQLSAGVNWNGGALTGVQVAVFYNRSRGLTGIQVGLVNNTLESMHGIQTGLVNTAGPGRGVQVGLVNSAGVFTGVQTGLVNTAGPGNGVQVGLFNSAGTFTGVQTGLVNIGGRVKGVQVGLVNIAEDSDLPIGLFNFVRKGQFAVQGWYDETGFWNAGLMSGGRILYTMFFGGHHHSRELVTAGVGIGARLRISERLAFRLEYHNQWFFDDSDTFTAVSRDGTPEMLYRARLGVEITLGRFLSLSAGVSFTVNNLTDGVVRSEHTGGTVRTTTGNLMWPGFYFGINLL